MKAFQVALILLFATLLYYLPIFISPGQLLNRGNDLTEYYWPIVYFTKEHLIQDHTLPFWNSMFFSGTPLLPDPQSLLFYPPNILFLILPINLAFVVWFAIHTFIGGIGAYLVAKRGFGFLTLASIFTAIFYITFPKTAGFLEAGHFTLVATIMWLPYLLLASIKLTKSPSYAWAIIFATCLTGLFFLFPTMAVAAAAVSSLIILGNYTLSKNRQIETLKMFVVGAIASVGLSAITLFPQLEWIPQTTRYILLQDRDVYPKWININEFVKALYPQIFGGQKFIFDLDSEKWIACGVLLSLLALFGFYKASRRLKILTLFLVILTVITSLNNVSPFINSLLSSDWYVLARVPTRNWFIVGIILVYLAGYGLNILLFGKYKRLAQITAVLAIIELLAVSWLRIERPNQDTREKVPSELFEYITKDKELSRVFCTTRCLSQSDVAKYNLETIEGYATIYQKNYYDYFIQLSQVYWDKYSSTLPPSSIYNFRQIQPIAAMLADYNVKFVISPYALHDKDFKEAGQFGSFKVYENSLFRTRAYYYAGGTKSEIEAPILYYSPNKIKIDTSSHKADQIVIAQTWNPGWKAVSDNGQKVKVTEAANKLMLVHADKETQSLTVFYLSESYHLGQTVTLFTIISLVLYYSLRVRKKGKILKSQRA